MNRWLAFAAVALVVVAAPVSAGGISGQYVEARTCEVWTGPCFANAETYLGGKHAIMAWKIDKGSFDLDGDKVPLDGLTVVAVVAASDTLGLQQTGPAKAVLLVDKKATCQQHQALINLAKQQGGDLVKNVVAIQKSDINLTLCACKENSCAILEAGTAKVTTRCLDLKHDKACGNESAYYPPLAKNVKAKAAVSSEMSFTGKAFNETWREIDRRGAYVGSFSIQ